MKKIYILYNTDFNEVITTSTDRGLLEELMYDYFLEDLQWEFYVNSADQPIENMPRIVRDTWWSVFDWYMNFIEIFESEVIS